MAGVSSALRLQAWNIGIFNYPPDKVLAGAYQAAEDPFLTWKDLFDDLLLCFDLERYTTGPSLALYLLTSDDVLANNLNTPFVYYDSNLPGSEQILSQIINITSFADVGGTIPFTKSLPVTVVVHVSGDCRETYGTHTGLASHLKSGTLGCHL